MNRIATLTLAAALVAAAPAGAQGYVRADCRLVIGAAPAQDALTAAWYRRFWTGDCGGLKSCLAGSPNWNQIVARLTARANPSRRATVRARACRLGARIGQEWTRPGPVRRIDSDDLRDFKTTLDRAGDVAAGLAKVEAQVRVMTGG